MSDTLDLDALAPTTKTIKVNGKMHQVHPARLKDLIAIQKLQKQIAESPDNAMDYMMDVMRPICPDIDEMNLSLSQFRALLEFVVAQTEIDTEKKTEPPTETSQKPSDIS